MEQDTVSWLWAFATIGGPILLGLALLYGVMKTKPWARSSSRGAIPPDQRTVNAGSWGSEDHLGDRR